MKTLAAGRGDEEESQEVAQALALSAQAQTTTPGASRNQSLAAGSLCNILLDHPSGGAETSEQAWSEETYIVVSRGPNSVQVVSVNQAHHVVLQNVRPVTPAQCSRESE